MSNSITPAVKRIITAILLLSAFMSLASQTMMITAISSIGTEFNVSLTTAQWLTTGYTLVIGVVTPLSANLYSKFSSRKVFLAIIAIFLLGTLLGIFAWDFWSVLAARLLQAIGSGIIMSFMMTTLVSLNPPEKRGAVLGSASLVVATGPAIGPTLAGIILNYLSWRYLFILFLPLFFVIWLVALFIFPDYSPKKNIKIDWLSVILSLLGTSAALASLTVVETNLILGLGLLAVGLILVYFFCRRQLRLSQPMLAIQILKIPSFLLMTCVGMCVFMILLGTEQIIPIFAERGLHTSSMVAGMILLPGALINACFAPIAGRIYDAHGPKFLVYGGLSVILLASIPLLLLSEKTPLWLIIGAYFVRMFGNACIFGPAVSESFKAIKRSEISHATALNNALRQFAGALSVTLVIVIANLPHSLTLGVQLALWLTVGLAILTLIIFTYYRKNFQH